MLVLTRRVKERLYIGENVCVTVLRLASGQVRLGIEAPRDVSVVRAELVDDPPATEMVHPAHKLPDSRPVTVRRWPFAARGSDSPRRGRSR
ncbi:MAG: carbon storage regulator [Isosphaeraceae bacterium]